MSADPSQFSVDDLFRGGGAPAVKFATVGTAHGGVLTDVEVMQERDFDTNEPLTWPDGRPKMMLVATIQTDANEGPDDDGQRRIFARYGMLTAIKEAVRAAKAKKPEVGGKLLVKYVGDAEPTRRGVSGAKQYKAVYQAPAAAAVEDLFGDEPAPAAKPAAASKAAPAESDDDLAAALAAFGD